MARPGFLLVRLIGGAALLIAAGCAKPLEPITVSGGTILVRNQTKQDWHQVQIDVNTWYRAGAPTISAGGFVNADVSTFIDGYSRNFDPLHTSIVKVVVKATDAAGQPVLLTWEEQGRR